MSKKFDRSILSAAIVAGLSVADACDNAENHDGYSPIRQKSNPPSTVARKPQAATAAKVPNYTDAQRDEMLATYTPGADQATRDAQVKAMAEKFGKSVRSISAKLSREKVLVPKVYKTKADAEPVKKDSTADAIGKILGLAEPDTESLTKCNKKALSAVFNALANSVPRPVETPEQEAEKAVHVLYIAELTGMEPEELPALRALPSDTVSMLVFAMGFRGPEAE